MNSATVGSGWAQVFFRVEGLPVPTSVRQFRPQDYSPATSVVPTAEFHALNDLMDFFHHHYDDLGLPRPLSRLDIICLKADKQTPPVACIMIDEEKDAGLLKDPSVPSRARQYYGDGSTPFFVWPAPLVWEFKEIT